MGECSAGGRSFGGLYQSPLPKLQGKQVPSLPCYLCAACLIQLDGTEMDKGLRWLGAGAESETKGWLRLQARWGSVHDSHCWMFGIARWGMGMMGGFKHAIQVNSTICPSRFKRYSSCNVWY